MTKNLGETMYSAGHKMGRSEKRALPQTRARSRTAECYDREREEQCQAGFVGPSEMWFFPVGIWTAGDAMQE